MIVVVCIFGFLACGLLMVFALCRAATLRDEMEERASAASCGQEKEERHETRHEKQPSADASPRSPSRGRSGGAS